MKQIVNDIIASIESESERWKCTSHTWIRDDGIEIWRENMPILSISLYNPVRFGFSLAEKVRLWLAFRKWQNNMTLARLVGRS